MEIPQQSQPTGCVKECRSSHHAAEDRSFLRQPSLEARCGPQPAARHPAQSAPDNRALGSTSRPLLHLYPARQKSSRPSPLNHPTGDKKDPPDLSSSPFSASLFDDEHMQKAKKEFESAAVTKALSRPSYIPYKRQQHQQSKPKDSTFKRPSSHNNRPRQQGPSTSSAGQSQDRTSSFPQQRSFRPAFPKGNFSQGRMLPGKKKSLPNNPSTQTTYHLRMTEWEKMGASIWSQRLIRRGFRLIWADQKPPLHKSSIQFPTPPSWEEQQVIDQEVKEMLTKGAIERVFNPSSPGFYSRIFTIPKATGGFRPILDLAPLNKFLKKRKFRMDSPQLIRKEVRQGN